ncbi:hypothetical protein AU252_13915 [Pseudarthrobacter sulfonivorans]|uniref:Uncharacterized protein n=1 Tax=Pseudarthrobacter sulfonivorans TaxID=121292 RepID=A0A0U2XDY6_9MICC|nr:hypothetical protein AU252_13915 [Pseudarthrobacter sulfonivorans]
MDKGPARLETDKPLQDDIEHCIVYVLGTAFHSNGLGRSELHLSFGLPSVDEVRDSARILGQSFTKVLAQTN